jgi:hypothetical protein
MLAAQARTPKHWDLQTKLNKAIFETKRGLLAGWFNLTHQGGKLEDSSKRLQILYARSRRYP